MIIGKTRILSVCCAVVLTAGLSGLSCKPAKKTYTVPEVTKEIESSLRKARKLKNTGELKEASELALELTEKVLKQFPTATLTKEPVKKLLHALEWMANMCLDRSLELKNESVSADQDDLSKKFRAWSDVHRDNMKKLRALIPRLRSAAVAARRAAPMEPTMEAMEAMDAMDAMDAMEPAREGGEPMQPAPDEPRAEPGEPGEPR